MSLPIGTQKRTSDGVIGTSGKKIRVYGFIVNSDSSGSAVSVYNGTGTGGVLLDVLTGAASVSTRIFYAGGLLFDSGCYIDLDATHTAFVTAIYEQESS
jgi:hypothetical protein